MKKIKHIGEQVHQTSEVADDDARIHRVNPRAVDLGLVACHCCGLVNPQSHHGDQTQYCIRCKSALHVRKDHSQSRTLALVIAATILYIPANVLPMTITDSLLGHQQDTIMSGVIYFWQSGDYFVAAVIFTASIFIPMVKLLILYFLVFVVRMQSTAQWTILPSHCSVLYRIVEFVGRWSMIDVFVVALLTALIQIQSLATILAGPGAVAFGAVVVLTMFASMSFDPRIIWDNYYLSQQRLNTSTNASKNNMVNQVNHLPSKNDFFQPR